MRISSIKNVTLFNGKLVFTELGISCCGILYPLPEVRKQQDWIEHELRLHFVLC